MYVDYSATSPKQVQGEKVPLENDDVDIQDI